MKETVREAEGAVSRVDTLEAANAALNAQIADLNERIESLKSELAAYVEVEEPEVFDGSYVSFTLPDGVTASEEADGVHFTRAAQAVQGRIYVWTDENGQTVTPDQMDAAQLKEYVLSTIYGDGERPEVAELASPSGYRFRSESAYADGSPCVVEICLMCGENAFYYMEVEGGEAQAEQVTELTDALLNTLTLKR